MLYLEGLTVQRGNKIVFSDFNTIIKSGSITLIKGKNGSGKSTLLRAIVGFTPLEKGTIINDKKNVFNNNEEWVNNLIFLDTKTGLSKDLTVIENLNAWSTMKGWSSNKENLIMALKSVGMDKYADLYISQSSEGLKKRAALARLHLSFFNKVDFWILDEPTNELDKTSLVLFKQLISKFLKQNGTIIIATHDLTIVKEQFNILDLDDFKKQRVS
ncbi:heme ABC exporter ATP-binding protein CcmA [Alphaproteobacteria bacterium]|nr:heme ABC exporter ATP-binding protein CcmA [Alphaproteobacteria bacterium]